MFFEKLLTKSPKPLYTNSDLLDTRFEPSEAIVYVYEIMCRVLGIIL